MIGYYSYSNYSGSFYDWQRSMIEMLNRARHREFIEGLARKQRQESLDIKSISMLTKTVNAPTLRTHIRQPCWRVGRWRSVTGGKGRQTI